MNWNNAIVIFAAFICELRIFECHFLREFVTDLPQILTLPPIPTRRESERAFALWCERYAARMSVDTDLTDLNKFYFDNYYDLLSKYEYYYTRDVEIKAIQMERMGNLCNVILPDYFDQNEAQLLVDRQESYRVELIGEKRPPTYVAEDIERLPILNDVCVLSFQNGQSLTLIVNDFKKNHEAEFAETKKFRYLIHLLIRPEDSPAYTVFVDYIEVRNGKIISVSGAPVIKRQKKLSKSPSSTSSKSNPSPKDKPSSTSNPSSTSDPSGEDLNDEFPFFRI